MKYTAKSLISKHTCFYSFPIIFELYCDNIFNTRLELHYYDRHVKIKNKKKLSLEINSQNKLENIDMKNNLFISFP